MSNYTVLYLSAAGHVVTERHGVEEVARASARRNHGILEDEAGNLLADYRPAVWND